MVEPDIEVNLFANGICLSVARNRYSLMSDMPHFQKYGTVHEYEVHEKDGTWELNA